MEKAKSILQIILLVSILAGLGATGTKYAILLDMYIAVPAIAALWAALGWFGIGVYEYGSDEPVRISSIKMINRIPPPKSR